MVNRIPDNLQYDLWTDGGTLGRNPSPIGGVWAWTLVNERGVKLECDSGGFEPKALDMPTLSNNVMELYAALRGLVEMPQGWAGFLYTDSKITWYRLASSDSFKGVPPKLKDMCLQLRARKMWTPLLVAGHPTKEDLLVGYNRKGLKASTHNQWCDHECRRQAAILWKKIQS